jgi:hypothetical protein
MPVLFFLGVVAHDSHASVGEARGMRLGARLPLELESLRTLAVMALEVQANVVADGVAASQEYRESQKSLQREHRQLGKPRPIGRLSSRSPYISLRHGRDLGALQSALKC